MGAPAHARTDERQLVEQARGASLVLDELHTRTADGKGPMSRCWCVESVRRARLIACCTSALRATMSSGGTWAEQQREVGRVASQLFGVEVKPERVIGETLQRVTPRNRPISGMTFLSGLKCVTEEDVPSSAMSRHLFRHAAGSSLSWRDERP